jgi:hypothetical protein
MKRFYNAINNTINKHQGVILFIMLLAILYK